MKKSVTQLISDLRTANPEKYQYLTDAQLVEQYISENPSCINFIDFGNPVPPQYNHLTKRQLEQINPTTMQFGNGEQNDGTQNPTYQNQGAPNFEHQVSPSLNTNFHQQYPNPTVQNQYQHGQLPQNFQSQNVPHQPQEEETGPWPWRTIISVLAFLFFVVRACYFNRH